MNSPTPADLVKQLYQCFRTLRPRSAVSLKETELRDRYEPEEVCLAERAKTPYQFWQDVPEKLLVETTGIGGPAFFNDDSWRFYTPAYLRLWLANIKSTKSRPDAIGSFAFSLAYRENGLSRATLFTQEQQTLIARVLLMDVLENRYSSACKALFNDFYSFLPAGYYTKKLHKVRIQFLKEEKK
jgi:hypothetical protein